MNKVKSFIKKIPIINKIAKLIYNLIRINRLKFEVQQLKNENNFLKDELFLIKNTTKEEINKFYDYFIKLNLENEKLLYEIEKLKTEQKQKDFKITILNEVKDNKKVSNHDKFQYLYKEFEDKFRGSTDEIKKQLSIYLPFLFQYDKKAEIIDIGCGRGEWLSLLKENGYSPIGIDSNELMVLTCKKQNLSVKQADALEYLKNINDSTISLITGFHIIEHFNTFEDILELFSESFRVLKSGGRVIFETPNPRNILVSSSDFYLDPSHTKPLHPLTLKFFLEKIGFQNSASLIIENDNFKEIDEISFDTIEDYVNIGRNFALTGIKL